MTEGKSAALQRLAVPSRQSPDLATGTGTDQFCVAAPLAAGCADDVDEHAREARRADWPGCREAPRRKRCAGRTGWKPATREACFTRWGDTACRKRRSSTTSPIYLDAADLELLRKNSKAALYEPLVGAAAHALAAVLDRVRHGTLPASVQRDAIIQQAATLAASLAARSDRWTEFRSAPRIATQPTIRSRSCWQRSRWAGLEKWRSS